VKNSLQAMADAGAQSATATNIGFDLLASLATYGPGSPTNASTFANAVIACQNVGRPTLPIEFSGAFGPNGAFAVRGGSATDKAPAASHDGLWGLEPPFTTVAPVTQYFWDQITVSSLSYKRFLAYGVTITNPSFSLETQVGSVFEWFTIPTLTFTPGVVVGTCLTDGGPQYLIQHNSKDNGGAIVPSATPSCPYASSLGAINARGTSGWSLAAIGRRTLEFFKPEPLLAVTLGTRPPGGSIGSLSPSVAVNPGQITLAFQGQVADGRTTPGLVTFTNGQPVSVTVAPTGGTPMNGVQVQLNAVNNLGTPVVTDGNVATTQGGFASFPALTISKAGGYRLVATIVGFGQNNASGFNQKTAQSNGFNLKQTK